MACKAFWQRLLEKAPLATISNAFRLLPVQDHEQDGRSDHNISSKSYQRCEHCDVHYYWYHLDDTQKYFFKFMVGDFQEKLTIPDKFVKNFRGQISEVVKLETADGNICIIQAALGLNKIVFGSGWREFASFYKLKLGYLLVFRYSGNSQFKVLIFDYASYCEKELFHVIMKCGPNTRERDICLDQSQTRERRWTNGVSSNSKSCHRCEHCDVHYYWHHLYDTQNHFFKLMIGDFRQYMTIPEKFLNNFRVQISEVIKLEAPDGNIYHIQVIKDQNKVVLGSGWRAFANSYEIKEHDLLVFRYSGVSQFKALIFDPSGCEKELFHVVMNCAPHVQERDIFHDQSLPMKTTQRNGESHDRDNERTEKMTLLDSPSPGPHDSDNERTAAAEMIQLDSPSPRSAGVESLEKIQDHMNSGGDRGNTEPFYVLETGCNLTTVQMARVNSLAATNRPRIPFYVRALDKTSLSGSLVICKDYAAKHLPHEDQPITLRRPGYSQTWGANLKIITDGTCILLCILSAGWPGFVRDNKLREGCICVFEVCKRNSRVTMIVHPFEGSYQPPAEEPEPPNVRKCPVKGESTEENKSNEEHAKCDYYYSKIADDLTPGDHKEIFRLASIQPDNPVYVAVIQKSHVNKSNNSLIIPNKLAAKHLYERSHNILLLRPNMKKKWNVRYYYNKGTRRFSCLRWAKFIRDNRLREGYVCIFELMKGAKMVTMMVHVFRKVDGQFALLN